MTTRIDYYNEDIAKLFLDLENIDVANYVPIIYAFDKLGGELHEEFNKSEKYYVNNSDIDAAEVTAKALSEKVGSKVLFIEYGSGNCSKSKPFLKYFEDLTGFVALDIDRNILERAKEDIKNQFPNIDMHLVIDDFFTEDLNLPKQFDDHKMKIFYLGSTNIGMFKREHLPIFFEHMSKLMKEGDMFIISMDPLKDIEKTYEFYALSSYEKFIKNILYKLNNEFNGNFDGDNFEHSFRTSREDECTYHSLISKKTHEVKINNKTYKVLKGKTLGAIINKYNYETIKKNGLKAGLKVIDSWKSHDGLMMNIGLKKGD